MSPDAELLVIFGALHLVALVLGGALFAQAEPLVHEVRKDLVHMPLAALQKHLPRSAAKLLPS